MVEQRSPKPWIWVQILVLLPIKIKAHTFLGVGFFFWKTAHLGAYTLS